MKILFLAPYPLKESPSQRFRFEQYFTILDQHSIEFTVQPFLESNNWKVFFKSGNPLSKLGVLLKGFIRRIFILFKVPKYDFVFIHREASPIGPPVFEWLIAKILHKKIIYDFDDAIWLTDRSDEPFLLRALKWRSKVRNICSWSYNVSCGNEYLCQYANQFNDRVVYNPTTIDTDNLHNPDLYQKKHESGIIIGWTGSHSTLKYLKDIENVLQEIETTFPTIKIIVIADRKSDLNLTTLEFKPWNKENEIKDLYQFDIGIMPLPDDEWAKGKCGFKALQYMALGIPVIASAVGVNTNIIDHGTNGFLARNYEEWKDAFIQLISDKELQIRLGKNGREKVLANYSVQSNSPTFISLFS